MTKNYAWWQTGIVYQIYPRSYQDSNGDGIGDLAGIATRLDYLKSINIDAVWLSPIYPSPMHDFGYDVADYIAINPLFGTMADFDHLLAELHQRDLKLILDLVPNHTSDEHAWFLESRSSRDNPKRDWYIWRDPAPDGGPPNNWLSFFGGPAWTFDETTGQYYLHQFDVHQPELNYRHPDVFPATLDNMRFWLDKGVDGFRVDVIWLMIKDEALRDEPLKPDYIEGTPLFSQFDHIYTQDVEGIHDLIREMRRLIDSYSDRVLIGEIYLPMQRQMNYFGQNNDECHIPYNFELILSPWQAQAVRTLVDTYEAALPDGAWPNWVLGNHDQHRVATRVGAAQDRVANMLLLTLRGTPTTYYGEEIGMQDGQIPLDKMHDPPAVNQPELAHEVGRDFERTPMQWDATPNAGFTDPDVEPWLPVAADYVTRNVEAQNTDPTSMLSFYRALTDLRRAEPSLHVGDYIAIDTNLDDIFAYVRSAPDADTFIIVLNFGPNAHTLDLSHIAVGATIALATDMVRDGLIDMSSLEINGNEGLLLRASTLPSNE